MRIRQNPAAQRSGSSRKLLSQKHLRPGMQDAFSPLMDLEARSLRSVPEYTSWLLCVAVSLPYYGAYSC